MRPVYIHVLAAAIATTAVGDDYPNDVAKDLSLAAKR